MLLGTAILPRGLPGDGSLTARIRPKRQARTKQQDAHRTIVCECAPEVCPHAHPAAPSLPDGFYFAVCADQAAPCWGMLVRSDCLLTCLVSDSLTAATQVRQGAGGSGSNLQNNTWPALRSPVLCHQGLVYPYFASTDEVIHCAGLRRSRNRLIGIAARRRPLACCNVCAP